MNYKPLPTGLFIKDSNIEGQGLFTTRDLIAGCELGESHYRIDTSGIESINEEENKNLFIRTPLGGFINHNEEPNCHRSQIRIKPGFDKWIITVIKNITAGEELTLKYTMYKPTKLPNNTKMAYLGGP
jgi:hypothetical protein|tara:strand:+ start:632 stop:1015 length:384 start_codon:yes stop_codon:yes gene_type:complete